MSSSSPTTKCAKCGADLKTSDKFCAECGTRRGDAPGSSTTQERQLSQPIPSIHEALEERKATNRPLPRKQAPSTTPAPTPPPLPDPPVPVHAPTTGSSVSARQSQSTPASTGGTSPTSRQAADNSPAVKGELVDPSRPRPNSSTAPAWQETPANQPAPGVQNVNVTPGTPQPPTHQHVNVYLTPGNYPGQPVQYSSQPQPYAPQQPYPGQHGSYPTPFAPHYQPQYPVHYARPPESSTFAWITLLCYFFFWPLGAMLNLIGLLTGPKRGCFAAMFFLIFLPTVGLMALLVLLIATETIK